MSNTLRVQLGHYARTRGVTGTSNPGLKLTEQDMNVKLAAAIVKASDRVAGLEIETVGADEKPGGNPDIFIALHMDGSSNTGARGGSLGISDHRNSRAFAAILKRNYQALGLPSTMRGDNYTTGLSKYYGYKSSYAGWGSGPKVLLENGFLTNNDDAVWARDNMDEVAGAIVQSAAKYLGLLYKEAEPTVAIEDLSEEKWYLALRTANGNQFSEAVKLFQERLNVWVDAKLATDGLIGPKTHAAFKAFSDKYYADLNAPKTPYVGQWIHLLGDPEVESTQANEIAKLKRDIAALQASRDTLNTTATGLRNDVNRLKAQIATAKKALG